MGLFDSVAGGLGQMLGGQQAQAGAGDNPMLQAVMGLLGNSGGLGGLVEKFQQGGLGNVVQSWVGTGANLPISAEQIQQLLGSGALGDLASKLGIQPAQAASELSQALPTVVDQLTPNGQLPAEGDLMATAQQLLGKFLG
ncbi:MAG: YidB family protein [Thiomonas sp.]|nr:YidB family protein [Thiomonas sp.]